MIEDDIEQFSLKVLEKVDYEIMHGPDIGPDGANEREYHEVVLRRRLAESVSALNPNIPTDTQEEAIKKVLRSEKPSLLLENKAFHDYLIEGVEVEFRNAEGEIKHDRLKLIDFETPENNQFAAVNQLTVIEGDVNRRPDVVLYVNGLPLVVVELKNAANAKADVRRAYNQIETYKQEIPSLFRYNAFSIISDGLDARMGSLSANFERYMAWKTIDGQKEVGNVPLLEVLLRGACSKDKLLDLVQNYIVFERAGKTDESYIKKIAAYHQYWAVTKAIESTVRATTTDHRAGVVWHTQGSGKSLSMLFYAGKMITNTELKNPTIVVVTDRNDLDGQLFDTFSEGKQLLRQTPQKAESRTQLRELLKRASGGVVFTTIQKFSLEETEDTVPILTARSNVIVIADEAHRSQYGLKAKVRDSDSQIVYGYAKYMRDALPNASYLGFTGTPINTSDKSTPAVFGDYVDIYDIKQAVEDKATVPIFYESRLIDLGMDAEAKQRLDQEVDDLMEGEELTRKDELKAKWAQNEAIVGNPGRIELIAKDIIEHFENRLETIDGKGMIVTMSRRIAVELYDKLTELRPDWHDEDDKKGFIKVIMTGSADDGPALQPHIRDKKRRGELADHMKDPKSCLKLVIVCDMWLTGFDAPSMHTMYLDKPMKGHNLMQAIARVNRVYGNKPGGLVVDYLGVAASLRDALQEYTVSGGEGIPVLQQSEAVAMMMQKYEIVKDLFHGFDYMQYFNNDTGKQLQIILDAQEHILTIDDGEKRLKQHVTELASAFALAIPHESALAIREQVAFFQAIKARLQKVNSKGGPTDEDYGMAIRQIVDKAIAPVGVVDIFAAAGLEKPNLSILSDEFLAEMRDAPRKNLAIEALQKLLDDEVKVKFNRNVVKARIFSEMLESALLKYKNKTIEAAQVIEELIEIAKKMQSAIDEGKIEGLSDDEIAFYDALVDNGSAKAVMDDSQLRNLAKLLVERVRANTTIDWQLKETSQARLRVEVKKVLNEFGYPPDQQQVATKLVLEQATLFADDWSK